MRIAGFSLIELVVVIVLLGILSATALPKFVDLKDDAKQAEMLVMKGAIASAAKLVSLQVRLSPENLNGNQNRFNLDNGDQIRTRGGLADGRWNNTFAFLVDFEDIAQTGANDCSDVSLDPIKWCVRQRNQGWFSNSARNYAPSGSGRGIIIFPYGYNVNNDRCYIYYLNQNDSAIPSTVLPSIIGSDFSEC